MARKDPMVYPQSAEHKDAMPRGYKHRMETYAHLPNGDQLPGYSQSRVDRMLGPMDFDPILDFLNQRQMFPTAFQRRSENVIDLRPYKDPEPQLAPMSDSDLLLDWLGFGSKPRKAN